MRWVPGTKTLGEMLEYMRSTMGCWDRLTDCEADDIEGDAEGELKPDS